MRQRRHLMVMLALVAALAVGLTAPLDQRSRPAEAGGSWSAWLYNYDTGKLVHVFPDGAAPVEMFFPLPPGTSMVPTELAISRTGEYLAACLTDDTGSASVRVYDIYGGLYIAAYIPAGPIMGCSLSRYGFSEDGSQLAFGIMNHWGDSGDSRPAWEVIVMQMNTSAILYHIDSNAPQIVALGHDFGGKLPIVTAFQMASGSFPGVMAFMPVQYGTEGAIEYDSIIWQLSDGSVTIYGPYGKNSLDLLLPNSEAIWLEENGAFPTGTPMEGPGFMFNVVMYSNKMGDLYPIFNNAGSILCCSKFVDDGRKVAVHTYTSGVDGWMTVDRSGAGGTLPPDVGQAYDLWGTLDGYVFLDNRLGAGAEVRYHRFTGGAFPEIYVAWSGLPGEYWRIIWVNPLSGGTGLPPFPSLVMLAPPPLLPTATFAPTLPPPPLPATPTVASGGGTSGLVVGARARIHTTEGDLLRIRSGPGLSFAVSFQLADGTPVTLLEGPRSADGLTWWRIQTDDGRGGWCIEGITDSGVYLQTLVPLP